MQACTHATHKTTCAQAAAGRFGFFIVRNHGIPSGVFDRVYAEARGFFSRSDASKRRVLACDGKFGCVHACVHGCLTSIHSFMRFREIDAALAASTTGACTLPMEAWQFGYLRWSSDGRDRWTGAVSRGLCVFASRHQRNHKEMQWKNKTRNDSYTPWGDERLDPATQKQHADTKEAFSVFRPVPASERRSQPGSSSSPLIQSRNQWPEEDDVDDGGCNDASRAPGAANASAAGPRRRHGAGGGPSFKQAMLEYYSQVGGVSVV
jgi:isopenicillin N synthase-like dioxygenase